MYYFTSRNLLFKTVRNFSLRRKNHNYLNLTGGEIIEKKMKEHRISHLFPYTGGAIMPVIDALYNSTIKTTICCHEQNAE